MPIFADAADAFRKVHRFVARWTLLHLVFATAKKSKQKLYIFRLFCLKYENNFEPQLFFLVSSRFFSYSTIQQGVELRSGIVDCLLNTTLLDPMP